MRQTGWRSGLDFIRYWKAIFRNCGWRYQWRNWTTAGTRQQGIPQIPEKSELGHAPTICIWPAGVTLAKNSMTGCERSNKKHGKRTEHDNGG